MGIKPAKMALALLCLTASVLNGCGGQADDPGRAGNVNKDASASSNGEGSADEASANPDDDIERLEKQAEKTPGDDAVREALARAYVRRGNSLRAANDLKGALKDYRRAIIYDEDNLEAQKNITELSLQVEGERTGEYGEPEPPPISPGVTAGDDDNAPAPKATATPAARKRS